MSGYRQVTSEEWLIERLELLRREKEYTRLRDELARARRALPVVRIEKNYTFRGPCGPESLADLFDGSSQLVVYHFMFHPDWSEGCKACSLVADHYAPAIVHLRQRDANLVTVSRAGIDRIESFRKRMGWEFKWVSSLDSDFNYDFNVSFAGDESGVFYNFQLAEPMLVSEGPGMSVFLKDGDGTIYHTYSCFSRGLEPFIGVYDLLDILPRGRAEDGLVYPMEWVRHHDRYGDDSVPDMYVELLLDRKRQGEKSGGTV